MAEETLQQQPPAFADELYKYAQDNGFIPKEATFDIFKKNLSNKAFVQELYDFSVQTEFIPKEATIDIFTKNLGGVEPPKKKEATVSPSTSGGGKQGYLSNALSSQFGAIPTVDERPVKGVTKQQVADRFGAIPEVKEPAVFEKKAIPDITKNKSVEKTLTSYDAVKTATKNYDDAKANLDALISTGSDAQGNRLMGFDPSTGQIIPDSPADKYKKQLEADLDNARLNAENTIKDFQKNVPSAKKTQLSLDKPKGQEKTPIETFVPPQEVQALEFVKDLSDAENYYKEVGLDINKAMDNALDIGASVFLDNDQRLLYDAIKSGDEKKYDEAKDYVYKEQLSRIAEIDKKLVTGGYNQDLLNEKRDLQAQMRDFFNPDAALKTVESSSPAMSAAAKIMGDIPAQDKLKLFYLKSFKEANDIALAKYGKPLFIEDKGRTVMNPDVRMDVENPFANEDEQGKKLREAIDIMKITAPAAMINKRPIEKTGNFIESFGKGIINAFGYKDTDIATQPITQQSTAFKNILGDAGIKESDLALGQKKFLDKAEKQSVGEFAGQTLGYATALALTLPIGSAELKAIQGVSKAYNATRLGRGIEGLLGLANETSMLGRALKLGTEAKLAGMTFGDKADELGILNIGAESIGSEFIEKALGSTKAGKLFGRVLTNMFGSKAGEALRTIGRINAFGLAEATGETAGTLVQLYQDSDSFKEFQDRIAQQFGDPSEALKFFLAAYTMGGVLGGARSNASEAIDTQTKDAYEALSPEDKNIADAVIAQDKQAADEAIADVVDKAAPTLPDEVVKKQAEDFTKAKEELDKVVDGEAYSVKVGDAVFEGSTPEELQADRDMAERLFNTYTNEQTEREAGKTETPAVQQPTGEDVGVGVTEEVIKETPEKVNLGQGVIKPNDRINKKIFIHETNAENIDKFDISKSGTGQGEAWLGRGIYLQESGTFKLEKYGKNKIEVSLSPSSKIFEVTETPDGEFRDSLVEWAVKNTDAGKRKYEERLKDGLDAKGILPRDILKRNPEVVDKLKEAGYDGLYQDGELVVYNPDVIKINKSKQTTEILPQEGLIKETPQNLNQAEPIVKAEQVQTSPMGETVQVKESISEKQVPDKINDKELRGLVDEVSIQLIKNAEENIGEGAINRTRVVEQANKIAKIDKSSLKPEHIAEAIQYEFSYADDFKDIRNAIKKGGIGNNYDIVQRMIEVGLPVPFDIVQDFVNSDKYKNKIKSSPELAQAIEELLAPKQSEQKAQPKVTEQIDKVADKAGIAPKNLRDLYNINRTLFGLNKVKSLAAAVAMDRMVGVMAKRAGITKAEMYARLRFKKASETDLPQGVKMQVDAWHGSPYEFDKFTTEKIGTGEGAQAFGWGLYFTDLRGIAEGYATAISTSKTTGGRENYYSEKEFDQYLSSLTNDAAIKEWAKGYSGEYFPKLSGTYYHILHKNKNGRTFVDVVRELYNNPKAMSLSDEQFEDTIGINKQKFIDFAKNFERNLYRVSLHEGKAPSDYTWLEWDKPVSEKIRNAVKDYILEHSTKDRATQLAFMSAGVDFDYSTDGRKITKVYIPLDLKGIDLYNLFVRTNYNTQSVDNTHKQASLDLLNLGIDGVKYPAESISRGATSDTARGFNYVVFDENAVSVKDVIKFQKDANKARGAVMVTMDGNAVIYALTDPNVSTPLHELAHVFEHYLTDSERAAVNNWAKTGAWTTETSEKFARGFEKYLSEGIAPTEGLKKVFEKFKAWLTDIYNGIKGSDIDIELNDDMRSIYAKMLGEDAVPTKKTKAAPNKAKTPIAPNQIETLDLSEKISEVNPSLFSSSAATREKAIRDVSPEIKEKVRKVNEVLSKENIPALVKAMENNPELFEKKYGLVKIC